MLARDAVARRGCRPACSAPGARGELTDGSDDDWARAGRAGRSRPTTPDVPARGRRRAGLLGEGERQPGRAGRRSASRVCVPDLGGADRAGRGRPTRNFDAPDAAAAGVARAARATCARAGDRARCSAATWPTSRTTGQPPRFLLNDVVRYWRTICVDFEGKDARAGGDRKWALRNAKLRTVAQAAVRRRAACRCCCATCASRARRRASSPAGSTPRRWTASVPRSCSRGSWTRACARSRPTTAGSG